VKLTFNAGAPVFRLATLLAFLLVCSGFPVSFDIHPSVYSELVRFAKYSSAVYQKICPRPLGNVLVAQFSELITNVNGFIVRDESRKEVIVAFRGTDGFTLMDYLTDARVILAPYNSPGVIDVPNGTTVHSGFLNSYNSVASLVISIVRSQLELYPNFNLVCTGHSLGGALASLAAISLHKNLQEFHGTIRLFTFGQPRTGNLNYSRYIEDGIGSDNMYRVVHLYDGVPTMVPQFLGYHHHATEYWQIREPSGPENVRKCTQSSEDPDCSRSIHSTGINLDHFIYLDHLMTAEPWLCL